MSESTPHFREENGDILPPEEVSAAGYEREAFDSTEYNLIPDAAFRAAERLLSEDAPQEKASKDEVKKAGVAERLMRIANEYRFVPQEKRELSDTYDLTGKDLIAGAATHLNIVLQRQDKYVETPHDSVNAIVRRYAAYADNAKKEAFFLGDLQKHVEDAQPHRFAAANSVSAVDVWRHEPSVSRPLLHVLRSRDVEAFMYGEDDQPNPLDIEYSMENRETVARLEAMVKGMRASELTSELKRATGEEKRRYEFWVKALNEARKHTAARGQAYAALVQLGEIKEEQ